MSLTLNEIYIIVKKIDIRKNRENQLKAKLHGFKIKNQSNDCYIDEAKFEKLNDKIKKLHKQNFGI